MENTIKQKLERANKLNKEIDEIRSFLELALSAQTIDEENAKRNQLGGVNMFSNCVISAYISTGSLSPEYKKTITNNETIVCLMKGGLAGVEEKLKEKESELQRLLS